MKLKEHIDKFDEALLEEKVNKPTSKNIGTLAEHIEKFDEALLEEKVNKPTSKNIGTLAEHIDKFDKSNPVIKLTSKNNKLQEHIAKFEESLGESPVIKSTSKNNGLREYIEVFEESLPVIKSTPKDVSFTPIEELQLKIQDKDKIIENLKSKSTELTEEVLTLEKEKDAILEELSRAKWLENNIASNTKKIYENKIKKMDIVDSTELIPMLIEVARKKQGNEKLNWGKWLEIPENIYLLQINEDMAKKVFEDSNRLIDEAISNINRERTYAGDEAPAKNYYLKFTGDTGDDAEMDYVTTNFDPDAYELWKGFTVSYWLRPDRLDNTAAAFGRRNGSSEQRFFFGIHGVRTWIGVGRHVLQTGDLKHGMETGRWYHWVVSYGGDDSHGGNRARKVYLDGELIWNTNVNWNQHTGEGSGTGGHNIYLGSRNNNGNYTNSLGCGLDEVAIFDEEKDASWVGDVYNGGTKYNHKGADNLVGYWKFNEGRGNGVEDLSGKGNHGTFVPIGTVNHTGDGTITTGIPAWEERE